MIGLLWNLMWRLLRHQKFLKSISEKNLVSGISWFVLNEELYFKTDIMLPDHLTEILGSEFLYAKKTLETKSVQNGEADAEQADKVQ